MSRSVVIVGGGVIGAACAHYLAKAGWRVTVLDQGAFGRACSHGNCGYVCPSHVLPLAEPGVIGQTMRALWRKNSPFRIKPRLDPALWAWLVRFALRANHATMMQDAQAIHSLLQSSRSLYDDLVKGEGLDCEWQAHGLLYVYRDRAGFEAFAHTDELLRNSFGMAATRYEGEKVRDLEPALKPGLAGGWHYPADAHLRPDKLMTSWRQKLESLGVTVRENCPVTRLLGGGGRCRAAATAQGEITADAFVVAAGALAPHFAGDLGCKLPIQPGKGYSLTMARPRRCPTIPLIFPEYKVAVTPMVSGYRIGSTMEFAGYDTSLAPERLQLLRDGVTPFLEEPFGEPEQERWFGWRPMTYDSKPIIGFSPALANVLIAAGHNMLGLSMAPGTGKLAAELLNGATPHLNPEPYAPRRF